MHKNGKEMRNFAKEKHILRGSKEQIRSLENIRCRAPVLSSSSYLFRPFLLHMPVVKGIRSVNEDTKDAKMHLRSSFGMFIEVLRDGASILREYLEIDTRCTFPLMCLDNTRDTPLPSNSIITTLNGYYLQYPQKFAPRCICVYTLRVVLPIATLNLVTTAGLRSKVVRNHCACTILLA